MKQLKHLFIVNPAAGKGMAKDLDQDIHGLFRKLRQRCPDLEYEIIHTARAGHAEAIAREHSARETLRIYSVGGDGTLNEVLNGMAGSDSSLAIIPFGTGNDFVQELAGDLRGRDLLMDTILGKTRPVDAASINGRYFINVASIGFDAKVNWSTTRFKGKPFISTGLAYIGGILVNLRDLSPLEITVDDGKGPRTRRIFMMTLCNGRIYGGGYRIAPEAKLDDGLLDIVEVAPLGLFDLVRYLPMLKKGTHLKEKVIRFYRTDHLKISSPKEILLNMDGETTFARDLDIRLHPGLIRVVVPRPREKTSGQDFAEQMES